MQLYTFELIRSVQFAPAGNSAQLLNSAGTRICKLDRPQYDLAPTAGHPHALRDAVMEVIKAGALRSERLNEILTQVEIPYSFFAMVLNLQPGRHRYTYELMSAAMQLSGLAVMQFKHHFRVRRPADRSPLVQPLLLTPGHGSFPAGHATQCHFLADLLTHLIGNRLGGSAGHPGGDLKHQLQLLADRVSANRVIAGLHYWPDIHEGKKLGRDLAKHFIALASPAPTAQASSAPAPSLQWLWNKAYDEEWN